MNGGFGKQEPARLSVTINRGLDGEKQLWRPLDLVDNHRSLEAADDPAGSLFAAASTAGSSSVR